MLEQQHHEQARLVQAFLGPFEYGDHEGFQNYRFGFKAGPSMDVFHLVHEIGHCAQLARHEVRRVNEAGWGFRLRSVWVYDRHCIEPMTTQATEREAEVFAMQAHLMHRVFGTPFEDQIGRFVDLLDWIPDACNIPMPDYDGSNRAERADALGLWRESTIRRFYAMHTPEAVAARFRENYDQIRRLAESQTTA